LKNIVLTKILVEQRKDEVGKTNLKNQAKILKLNGFEVLDSYFTNVHTQN
jgi:hypothetical protein